MPKSSAELVLPKSIAEFTVDHLGGHFSDMDAKVEFDIYVTCAQKHIQTLNLDGALFKIQITQPTKTKIQY